MRKSFVCGAAVLRSAGLNLAGAVAIGLLGGWSAQAATLTETFTFAPLAGYAGETGSAFSAFDPALGTLNSVTYDVVATATFTGGGPSDLNDAAYELTFVGVDGSGIPVLTNRMMTAALFGNGVTQASLTSTDASLSTYLVPGAVTPNLNIVNASGAAASLSSTFPTESVTYNYTPATPVPEPPSIALLAVGLSGLGWTLGRRRRLIAPPAHC